MPTVWVSDHRIESGEPFSVECEAGGLRALDRNEEAEGSVLVGAALARFEYNCSIGWRGREQTTEEQELAPPTPENFFATSSSYY